MATYHCSVKVGGKGKASGHAAYIAREEYYAERAGYEDLEATGYGNLPTWAEHEPAVFWSAADRYERANGTTYRELEIALPRELNPDQRQATQHKPLGAALVSRLGACDRPADAPKRQRTPVRRTVAGIQTRATFSNIKRVVRVNC